MTGGLFVATATAATWVDLDPVAPEADGIRREVALAETIDALVTALTTRGLAATPAFVLAAREASGVRILVRGEASAEAVTEDGRRRIDSGRAISWREEFLDGVVVVSLGPVAGPTLDWVVPVSAGGPDGPVALRPAPTGIEVQRDHEPEPEPDPRSEPDAEPPPSALGPRVEDPHTLMGDDLEALSDELGVDETPEAVESPPADDPDDFDFSNLLDHTQFRDVESAAVRPVEDQHEEADGAADDRDAVDASPADPQPEEPPPAGDDASPAPGVSEPPPAAGGLISGIPGTPPPSVPASPAPAAPVAPSAPQAGDHDGHTMSVAELRALREGGSDGAPAPAPSTPPTGAVVQATHCPNGHPNPPSATTCRLCGSTIDDRGVATIPRPVVARLRFESGTVVEVDRPQLLGRRPSTDSVANGAELPGLVTLPSPDAELSRVHAAVRLEGWSVLIEDFGSTNGTEVQLPGQDKVRLREHEPVLVVPGTVVTLAEVVCFTVEAPTS